MASTRRPPQGRRSPKPKPRARGDEAYEAGGAERRRGGVEGGDAAGEEGASGAGRGEEGEDDAQRALRLSHAVRRLEAEKAELVQQLLSMRLDLEDARASLEQAGAAAAERGEVVTRSLAQWSLPPAAAQLSEAIAAAPAEARVELASRAIEGSLRALASSVRGMAEDPSPEASGGPADPAAPEEARALLASLVADGDAPVPAPTLARLSALYELQAFALDAARTERAQVCELVAARLEQVEGVWAVTRDNVVAPAAAAQAGASGGAVGGALVTAPSKSGAGLSVLSSDATATPTSTSTARLSELQELTNAASRKLSDVLAERDTLRGETESLQAQLEAVTRSADGTQAKLREAIVARDEARREAIALREVSATAGDAGAMQMAVGRFIAAQKLVGEAVASVRAKRPLAPAQVAKWLAYAGRAGAGGMHAHEHVGAGDGTGGDSAVAVAEALLSFPASIAPLVAKVVDTESLELLPSAHAPFQPEPSHTNLEALLASVLSSCTQKGATVGACEDGHPLNPFSLSRSLHGSEVDALPVSVRRLAEVLMAVDDASAGKWSEAQDVDSHNAARGARIAVVASIIGDLHFRGADVGVTYALSSFLSAGGGASKEAGGEGVSEGTVPDALARASLECDTRIDVAIDRLYAGAEALATRAVGSDAQCVALIDAFAECSQLEASVSERLAEIEREQTRAMGARKSADSARAELLRELQGDGAGAMVASFEVSLRELHERAGSACEAAHSLREGAREAHERLAAYEGRVARVDPGKIEDGMRKYARAALVRASASACQVAAAGSKGAASAAAAASEAKAASMTALSHVLSICEGEAALEAAVGAAATTFDEIASEHAALRARAESLEAELEGAATEGDSTNEALAAPASGGTVADTLAPADSALVGGALASETAAAGGVGKRGDGRGGGQASLFERVLQARAAVEALSGSECDALTRDALLGIASLLVEVQTQVLSEREAANAKIETLETGAQGLEATLKRVSGDADRLSARIAEAEEDSAQAEGAAERACADREQLWSALKAARVGLLPSSPEDVVAALDHLATVEAKRYALDGPSVGGLAEELVAAVVVVPRSPGGVAAHAPAEAEQRSARAAVTQALGEDADSKRALVRLCAVLAAERADGCAARREALDAAERAGRADDEVAALRREVEQQRCAADDASALRREVEVYSQRAAAALQEVQAQCRKAAAAQPDAQECKAITAELIELVESSARGRVNDVDEDESDVERLIGPTELLAQLERLRAAVQAQMEARTGAEKEAARRAVKLEAEAEAAEARERELKAEALSLRAELADAREGEAASRRWRARAGELEGSLADAAKARAEDRELQQETLLALRRAKEDNRSLAGHVAVLEEELEDILRESDVPPPSPRTYTTPLQLFQCGASVQ